MNNCASQAGLEIKSKQYTHAISLIAAGCLMSFSLQAADWSKTVGIGTSVVYTDNANLSETQEDDEISLLFTPNITIKGEGARASVDIAGALQLDSRGKGSDSTNPRLRANADAELVERVFFVDLESTITQDAINPYSPVGSDAINDTGNVTTTYTYTISPYLVGRFKGYADFQARYSYDEVSYSKNNLDGSNRHSLTLGLTSGTRFGRLNWGVSARQSETEYDNNRSTEFSSADINLGYRINRAWQVNTTFGKEWNDYTSIQSDTEGDRWDVGVIWTPSPRTSVDLKIGNRFFGDTTSLNFSHKSKRSVLEASYSQDLTNSRSLRDQDIFSAEDPFGDLIDPITGDILPVGVLSTINDSTIVDKRFDASYTLKGRRSTLTIKAHHSQQTHQDSTRDVEQTSFGIDATRSLTGKLSANASLTLRELSQNSSSDADIVGISLGVDRKLGQNSSVGLKYRITDRDSDQAGSSYTENRITASLSADF
ncbi:MAG: TIGR03016 family PEP-CTERM system-associated outer membrane protein [Sedimenticola sp.]